MRTPALLLLVAFLAYSEPPLVHAQAQTDSVPVAARWNRLVPKFLSEATTNRRAARTAAAGDSAALRKLAQSPLPLPFNIYTVLSVAQYAAVNTAREKNDASPQAAVASASATVLTGLFKDSAVQASIARELSRDLDQSRRGARGSARANAGKTLGEDVARRVAARAPTLNLAMPWSGTIPKGPGMWYSAPGVPPIGVTLASARTWVLDSTSQFRPPPPPAFGSPAFEAAMEDVRRVARERTAEQIRIAQYWNSGDPWAMWNETAASLLIRRRASEAQSARVLAVLNAAASDAAIACFEAKYHYWTIRPSQVDTTLKLADSISLPNFPAYPSGHACSAGAFDAVLGHFFPEEKTEFTRRAEEQAMSRLYGGVHYRFDNDVGLELGRSVARFAIQKEQKGWMKSFLAGK